MTCKNYTLKLALRLFFIVVVAFTIGVLIMRGTNFLIAIVLAFVEGALILSLFSLVNQTHRKIAFFIQSIKNEDTSLNFPVNDNDSTLKDLHKSLNELNVIVQNALVQSRIKEQYFSEIIKNIDTGIIVLGVNGFVYEVNPAALRMLHLRVLTHLKQIQQVDMAFGTALSKLESNQKQTFTFHSENEPEQFVVRCSVMHLKGEEVRLLSMQDIRGELERKELDSWVKLIRVMSHEIMNSLAPVTSIAGSLKSIWKEKLELDAAFSDDEDVRSTIDGLDVISERGRGLSQFVQNYRKLTKVPVPQLSSVSMQQLFDRLSILVSPMKAEYGVAIKFYPLKKDFQVQIDEQMMVQVIVNLVKNAAEAASEQKNPMVEIAGRKLDDNQVEILVVDNGKGISEEIAEEVFVPFFTTKSSGSGIGLSHSRQIMRAHGGTVNYRREKGKTVFAIVW